MNNELIGRIKTGIKNVSGWTPLSKHKRQLLHDCEAEIERLLLANETLKELSVEYLERVKALESKPSIEVLIAEIDEILIDAPDMGVAYSLRRLANKYRVGRRTK